MELIVSTKSDFVKLMEKFDKTGKHLHNGLWTEKVVLIDQHSTFMRVQNTPFIETISLLLKSQISFPMILTAETPKDYLNIDIKITKTRDGFYILDFQSTPMRPVKEFLIREYEMHLMNFVNNLKKLLKLKEPERKTKKKSSSTPSSNKKKPSIKKRNSGYKKRNSGYKKRNWSGPKNPEE